DKRATYDSFGHSGTDRLFEQGFEGFGFGGIGDIFNAFWGGASTANRQAAQHGADLQSRITITFEEAAFGCTKEINILRTEYCSLCQGIGCKEGSQPIQCPNCNGTGQVQRVQQSIFGRFIHTTPCNQCHSSGKIINDPCTQCRGTGHEKSQRNISVKIPAGVDEGTQIRLMGEGDIGSRGGSTGNLYIRLSILPHEYFTRDGDDILYDLPVNFAQVALGSEIEVPTLYGNAKIKIPNGCQTGKVFNLKNKGIPHLNRNGQGDQLVTLRVVTPEKLTKQQKQLFQELADSLDSSEKK
ncbi:MAG: DnaJ C-terminal domain-containing protein, partial [Dehalococcoidales bacterium]|nr:DnaJ C-terminal domain-containing protein [Dehalococcoidales bacterium]